MQRFRLLIIFTTVRTVLTGLRCGGWSMSTRMFSDDQLERLRSYPDIGRDDLIRYFTLAPASAATI